MARRAELAAESEHVLDFGDLHKVESETWASAACETKHMQGGEAPSFFVGGQQALARLPLFAQIHDMSICNLAASSHRRAL